MISTDQNLRTLWTSAVMDEDALVEADLQLTAGGPPPPTVMVMNSAGGEAGHTGSVKPGF